MILYPAIDLYDGMAVRLRQGRYDDMTVYDRDPKSLALRMRDAGTTHLHMVDLEGARSGSTALRHFPHNPRHGGGGGRVPAPGGS